jgi:hypothetical protein
MHAMFEKACCEAGSASSATCATCISRLAPSPIPRANPTDWLASPSTLRRSSPVRLATARGTRRYGAGAELATNSRHHDAHTPPLSACVPTQSPATPPQSDPQAAAPLAPLPLHLVGSASGITHPLGSPRTSRVLWPRPVAPRLRPARRAGRHDPFPAHLRHQLRPRLRRPQATLHNLGKRARCRKR